MTIDRITQTYQQLKDTNTEDFPQQALIQMACTAVLAESIDALQRSVVDLETALYANADADEDEDEDDEDDDPTSTDLPVPVLAGSNPVSLLQEVCQARCLTSPEYDQKAVGDVHTPAFTCMVTVGNVIYDDGGKYSTKAKAKAAAARNALIMHFSAVENYGGNS